MSTAVKIPIHGVHRVHYVVVAKTRMYCVQPNCDGVHHFYTCPGH